MLHPETKRGVAGGKARQGAATDKLSFAAATAAATGGTDRTVRRAAARGEKLGADLLDRIAGTSLDKGAELDALAALPTEQREDLVTRAVAGEAVSARPRAPDDLPDAASAEDPTALTDVERLQSLFLALGVEDRQAFLSRAVTHLQREAA